VFAPRSGGPLLVTAAALLLVGGLGAVAVLPFPLPVLVLWVALCAAWTFFAWFFRDPERSPGEGVVSAADGRVRAVEERGDELLISVFMNVTDVHVNRLPLTATFERVGDAGAGHRAAYRPDAERNVARTYELSTALGPVRIVQITGVLARRLVSFVGPGTTRQKGERFGMIVLGSRVDVFLPRSRVVPTVRAGDRVHAGSTTIAREPR
jgi:phosphatidylserine decarboxylase